MESCILWAHKPREELFLFKGDRQPEKDVLSRGVHVVAIESETASSGATLFPLPLPLASYEPPQRLHTQPAFTYQSPSVLRWQVVSASVTPWKHCKRFKSYLDLLCISSLQECFALPRRLKKKLLWQLRRGFLFELKFLLFLYQAAPRHNLTFSCTSSH